MSSPNDPKKPTDTDTPYDFDAMLEGLPGAGEEDGDGDEDFDDLEDDGWEHPEELVLLAAQRFPDAGEPGGDKTTEEAIAALCKEIDPEGKELADWYEGAAVFDLGELVGPPGRLDVRAVCFVDRSETLEHEDDEDEEDGEELDQGLVVYLVVCTDDHAEVLASSFMLDVAPQVSTPQDRMRLASLLLDGLSQLDSEGLRLSLEPRFGFLAKPYDPIIVGTGQKPEDRAAARAARIKAMKRGR
ncbi:MAG TPA: hypothetical protein PK095_07345 [Myxococcota bacterium]|nr:hypothetical protein [Myxococcota bacterium]